MGHYYFSLLLEGLPVNEAPLPLLDFLELVAQFYQDPSIFGSPSRVEILRHADMYPFLSVPVPLDYPNREQCFVGALQRLPVQRVNRHLALNAGLDKVPGVIGKLGYTCEPSLLSRLRDDGVMSILHADGGQCAAGELLHLYWIVTEGGEEKTMAKWSEDAPKVRVLDDGWPVRLPSSAADDLVTVREWRWADIPAEAFD